MLDTELNTPSQQAPLSKKPFLKGNLPLAMGAAILVVGSGFLGYSIGHRQGLTVVGFEADAEQLVEVVQKQKSSLETLNKGLNLAVQERDVAVSNSNDLFAALNQARVDKNWALSDQIRDQLSALGIQLKDGAEGTTFTF